MGECSGTTLPGRSMGSRGPGLGLTGDLALDASRLRQLAVLSGVDASWMMRKDMRHVRATTAAMRNGSCRAERVMYEGRGREAQQGGLDDSFPTHGTCGAGRLSPRTDAGGRLSGGASATPVTRRVRFNRGAERPES